MSPVVVCLLTSRRQHELPRRAVDQLDDLAAEAGEKFVLNKHNCIYLKYILIAML